MRRHYPSNPEHDKLVKPTWPAVRRLLSFAKPYRLHLVLGGLMVLLSAGINLSMPILAKSGIDELLRDNSISSLDRLALLIAGLFLLAAIISFTQHVLLSYVGNRIVTDVRQQLFSHLQRLPVAYFDKSRSGDLASHLSNDVSLIQTPLTSDLAGLAGNIAMLVGGIAVLLYINWSLTVIVVGILALVMLGFVIFGRKLRKLTREALDSLADAMGGMTEAIANIRLVKAFAREPYESERSAGKLDKVLRLNIKTSVAEGAMGTVAFTGFMLLLLGVSWYGGRAVMAGTISAGSMAAFFMTVFIISGPMGTLASLYTRLQRAVGAAERIFAIIDEPEEGRADERRGAFPQGDGNVEFDGVHFQYVEDVPVIQGLSLKLPAGKVTALVGASGGGKSTLASLLYRFYEPQQGGIRVNGVPIRDVARDDLRSNIGIVPQDPILFNGTIRENILYGKLDATEEELQSASRAANVAEFVESFPEGLETIVGERGVTLSGGQRQRVAIARALLKNPRILILDEATSSLDNRSEALVKEALDRLMQGRTTLVIAHRLSTVRNADQIAVLDEGRVVELGTHEDLMAQNSRYAELQNIVLELDTEGVRGTELEASI